MAEYLSPGIYVEELSGGIKPIEGVGTSTGAFIGIAERGPIAGAVYEDDARGGPVFIPNFSEFTRVFGSFVQGEYLAYAVQQFFGEGGTRCYVARTAHFANPADPSTLTARRASRPLPGRTTSIPAVVGAGATSATAGSVAGLVTGMHLFLTDGTDAARVRVTALPGGNTVDFENTVVDNLGVPVAIPALGAGATVTQIALDVLAINEGAWGNRLRVAIIPAGRVTTVLDMPGSPTDPPGLPAGDTEAGLASLDGIEVGATLFISDGTAAARVRVTGVDEGARRVQFVYIERNGAAVLAGIADGAAVSATISGKASSVLAQPVTAGDTSIVVASTAGIERGSVLLIVNETVGSSVSPVSPPAATTDRVVVTRVVGPELFFDTPLANGYADGTSVSTEDFTLVVYDRTDIVETYANLSMIDTHVTDYVTNRINTGGTRSRYIRVREGAESADELPQRTRTPLRLGELPTTEGVDGDADQASDYLGNAAAGTGFNAFDPVDDINIVAAPGITFRNVILAGMNYCERRADCFFVGDVPRELLTAPEVLDFKKGTGLFAGQQSFNSTYGAVYWPWVQVDDPITLGPILMAPAGAVAGSYSATDVRRGVHKAPAGVEDGFLNTAVAIQKIVTKAEQDLLNPAGVNVIRSSPDFGIALWGTRTVSSDPEWRYLNVRRLFLFLEESIQNGTYWAVFEPNDETLWKRLVKNISAFLRVQWLEGKLVGSKPEEAFFVKCDAETNPPESVDLGRVITVIGVAPSKPAEFVIFRIMQSRPGAGTA
jgi:phage tail sheath protein FI